MRSVRVCELAALARSITHTAPKPHKTYKPNTKIRKHKPLPGRASTNSISRQRPNTSPANAPSCRHFTNNTNVSRSPRLQAVYSRRQAVYTRSSTVGSGTNSGCFREESTNAKGQNAVAGAVGSRFEYSAANAANARCAHAVYEEEWRRRRG